MGKLYCSRKHSFLVEQYNREGIRTSMFWRLRVDENMIPTNKMATAKSSQGRRRRDTEETSCSSPPTPTPTIRKEILI